LHGVCGNNNEVSFVTNLLVLHVTNTGKFRLNVIFGLSFIEDETKKLLRRSTEYVSILYLNPGKHTNSYKRADDIS